MITPAVIYARVSSKEQEREGYSIDAQLRLLREYADREGFQVQREYIEVGQRSRQVALSSGRCWSTYKLIPNAERSLPRRLTGYTGTSGIG